MPNKTHLNIFLIKEGFKSPEDIVRKFDNSDDISESLTLFTRKAREKIPDWVETFFQGKYQLDSLRTSIVSVLLLMKVTLEKDSRYFALAFGLGRHMLVPESIETRFGLKTVLNLVKDNAIRKIDTTNIAGNARKTSEQMPMRSTFSEFSIDIERDLLEGVTAIIPEHALFKGTVTGKDSISGNSELNVDSIISSLPTLLEAYESNEYKSVFPWVDQITSVKDRSLIERLEETAVSNIINDSSEIWMAVPEVIKWENIRGFKCPGLDETMDDIDIAKVKSSFRNGLSSFDQLKHKPISAMGAVTNSPLYRWNACNCLYGEMEYEGNLYCLSNGNWYLVDKNYSKRVESDYSKATISDFPFIEYTTQSNEGEYNKELAESNPSDFILMDTKLIPHGAGHSSIELCDVYDRSERRFIHVKKNSGSAVLSHLYNQGLVSARLMKADPKFVDKVSEKLNESTTNSIKIGSKDMREVVYGIISKKSDNKLPNVPFFSKVTYLSVAQQLNAMGVRVSIASIHQRTCDS